MRKTKLMKDLRLINESYIVSVLYNLSLFNRAKIANQY